ncbi:MAG: Hsp33 family molecular chaperone HslO, partial [Victivallales bacterium]
EMPVEKLLWTILAFAAGKEKCVPDSNNMSYGFAASPGFNCTCSKSKMKQALATLGKDDLKRIFEKNEDSPQITCQFCRKQYSFKKEELKDIFEE